jgi:4-amino-4-deoxy-L-arabinose transferase-like glycosyltransferase
MANTALNHRFGISSLSEQFVPNPTRPFPLHLILIIAFAYIFVGLIGHDPWKQDEAYIFSSVWRMLGTGDWLVPYVAGEPFMEKPPLFHWTAAVLALLSTFVLEPHDGARLASGLFFSIILLAVGWTARQTYGRGKGRLGVLAALSCLGYWDLTHLMMTDIPLSAGIAVAMAGLIASAQNRRFAGAILGVGIGMSFLAKGLIGPGVIGVVCAGLFIISPRWRTAAFARQLGIATVVALPWLTLWPLALYARSPELFTTWLWDNNVGRLLGFSVAKLGADHKPGFWWGVYPWFLFPLWLFILPIFFDKKRAEVMRAPAMEVCALFVVTIGLLLAVSASARAQYALPMLAPLAVIAARYINALPRWIERPVWALSLTLMAVAAGIIWYVWVQLALNGEAPAWAWLSRWLPRTFAMEISWSAVALAVVCSLGALFVVIVSRKRAERFALSFVAAITLAWCLVATLWLPWIDHAKSYRDTYEALDEAKVLVNGCVSSVGVGESERAMLEYFLGIVTERVENTPNTRCPQLLLQTDKLYAMATPGSNWALAWSGHRNGDNRELLELFIRK